MRRSNPVHACLIVAVGIAGCTVGPNYRRPDIATPAVYSEATASAAAEKPLPAPAADLSAWWMQFNDPMLTDLIHQALANNLDLKSAVSRVRAARLQETIIRAAEYPSVSAAGDALRLSTERSASGSSSGGGSNSGSGGGGGLSIPSHLNLYGAGFDATWEVDLFGGTRRSVEAAKASTEAAVWARRDGEVSLTAEVANDYLTLRALQARIEVGRAELERQKSLFALIHARRESGFVTQLDVNQQSTAVDTAAAQIPALEAQAKGEIHALGVLLGESPETLTTSLGGNAATLPPPPPMLPIGLPSDLLRRRPDIREAERQLASSNAQIGVQVANLYPKVNLLGFAGFASTSPDDFFSRGNFVSTVLGMATEPLFDAGKRRASVAAAREDTVQSALAYRTAVLAALRDVEDALSRYRSEDTRRTSLARSVDAAQKSLTIAEDQYKTGFVSFINVLQSQYALLNAQDQLTQSDAQLLTDLVALYKALGGGWSQ